MKSIVRISALLGFGVAMTALGGCAGELPPANQSMVGHVRPKPWPPANQPLFGKKTTTQAPQQRQASAEPRQLETLERTGEAKSQGTTGGGRAGGELGYAASERTGAEPRAAQGFATQVQQLSGVHGDARHTQTVSAIRAMAGAVRGLGSDASFERSAGIIEADADQLARSGRQAQSHTETTRNALLEAVGALVSLHAERRADPELQSAIDRARAAVGEIDPKVPYLQQEPRIDRAFERVATAFEQATRPRG